MTDYGHELRFGTFLTPTSADPGQVVGLAQLSERVGLDLVTFQDHPYQTGLLDAWTLLSYLAGATTTVRLAPNVLNLPHRPPAVVARAVASLDRLSGGRIDLGLGAGAFPDAVGAMGGPRRTPGESVEALGEAIEIIRGLAKRGPETTRPIEIWLGAYKPRLLQMTGRVADGWLPSAGYLPPDGLAAAGAIIDEAAREAGRPPAAIRRLYTISGRFSGDGFLQGPPTRWVEDLTALTVNHGISVFILGSDDPETITRFAAEVMPGVREQVAEVRGQPMADTAGVEAWDESGRPTGPEPDPDRVYTAQELANGQQLVAIHDHLRNELNQIQTLVAQVADGSASATHARTAINEMTVRQNNWTVGAYCATYCRLVTTHHTVEDQALFPRLRRADPRLSPVIDRLAAEHVTIHGVLERLDGALVAFVSDASGTAGGSEQLHAALDLLSATLLSHLSYEERELVEPLARLGVLV
jgi:alkanesulfonate monooxygenase SsuD/methylene tetrahydromethanopterin reductase-like flavin-dependent oxidoreductase (luciferase family)